MMYRKYKSGYFIHSVHFILDKTNKGGSIGGHDCIQLCNSRWRKFLFTLADFKGQMLFWSQFEMSRKLPFKYGRL